jgi:hypothetical protein
MVRQALGRDAPRHPPLPGPVNEEAEQVAQHVIARRDPGEDVVLDGIKIGGIGVAGSLAHGRTLRIIARFACRGLYHSVL